MKGDVAKKTYSKPELAVHGTVAGITRAKIAGDQDGLNSSEVL